MKTGDRVVVVKDGPDTIKSEDNIIGWTGVIVKLWYDGSVCVTLDPELDPECDLTLLAFDPNELEVIA